MTFQIKALAYAQFEPLFAMSDEELRTRKARRETVAASPGAPCRVSLVDAEVGEEVLLVNYEHQGAATPYRASHAVFVRKDAAAAAPAPGEVPIMLRSRLMSLRAFSADHDMIDADAVDGTQLESGIARMFGNPSTDYIHLHFAKRGCYAALVTRA